MNISMIKLKLNKLLAHIKNIFTNHNLYIIDYCERSNKITLVSNNIHKPFTLKLNDVISDCVLIKRLHPSQACYIGLIYGRQLKVNSNTQVVNGASVVINEVDENFIGYDRNSSIMFFDKDTNLPRIENIIKVASTYDLICHFKPLTAFNIGVNISCKVKIKNVDQSIERLAKENSNVVSIAHF